MITQQSVKRLFDYVNGDLIWAVRTAHKIHIGDVAGTLRGDGYLVTQIFGKLYRNHRIVFLYHNGYLPKYIDHIDGNKLNNIIKNLRECTLSENNHNSKSRKNNTSGIKGVCWDKARKKWSSEIWFNNKKIFLGRVDDIEVAAQLVRIARIKYHGEFARNG